MGDPIGRVSGSGVVNTTTNDVQNTNNKSQGNFGPNRAPNPADRNTVISFKGGTVYKTAPVPDNYKTAIESIKQPKPSNTFLHKLGRAVLWIVNLFKGVKSSSSLSTNDKLDVLRNKKPDPLPDNISNKGSPYYFSLAQLANLAGIDSEKGLKYEPFYNIDKEPNKSYKEVLFPQGEPRLADIKQNPELQDCWFLSAISSLLQTQGTESIERLFSESKNPGNVVVRLGTNLYEVPMGRIANGSGDKFGSDSAPWVVALENAMLMHLSLSTENPDLNDPRSLDNYKDSIKMPLRSTGEGLVALLGSKPYGEGNTSVAIGKTFSSVQDGVDVISKLLSLRKPVVIGHNRIDSNKIALRDGIAPGHAVTVLEVIPNGFKILDPYGQVKTLSKDNIVNYSLYSVKNTDEPDGKYAFLTKDVDEAELPEGVDNNDKDDW